MMYREISPHAVLAETVRCFWVHEATFEAENRIEITPDGCVELIFNFGSPYVLLSTTPPTALPVASIVGFTNKPMPLAMRGTLKVVAARLFAWGALALLQDDVGPLANAVTSLGPDWDALVPALEARVAQGDYDGAASALQDFLVQRLLVRSFDAQLIQAAAKRLHHTRGTYRIAELAEECRMSVRQLERGFQRVIGASPKTYARTLRFEQAQRRLMFEEDVDLTGLALECGYFDQAHFIKDFKAFAGRTPSEYAARMRELRELLGSKDVVFLQSPARKDG